jgi:hypothetical protein
MGEAAQAWSASGRLVFSGAGTWSPEAGPVGEVRVELREGWARSDALDVEVSGIELKAASRDLAGATFGAGQTLRIAKVVAGGVEVRAIELDFSGGMEAVAVERLQAAVFGGQFRAKPFKVSLANPAVDAAAEVEGLFLKEMAALMPWAVATAEGKLQGRIKIGWDAVTGLRIREGGLSIVKTDAAEFRLAPAAGFLTGSMPRRFTFLPPWMGKWAKKVGPVNPAYEPLSDIEMGRVGLKIESLVIEFRPDGTLGERSATVRVLGRPTSGELVEEVTVEMNLFGPLADALLLGMDERVKLKVR